MNADQIERELETRRRMAPVAVIAAVLLVVSAIVTFFGPQTTVNEATLTLIYGHKRFALDMVGAIVKAGGLIGVMLVLAFLARATRARNPQSSGLVRGFVIGGGLITAIGTVAYEIALGVAANDFVSTGQQTYSEAHRLETTASYVIASNLPLLGAFVFAIVVVMVGMSAMRVGLLPKGMGYIGILVGILFLVPVLGSVSAVIQGCWLAAIGYLFAGNWSGEYPPAWASGTAIPWPKAPPASARGGSARGGARGGSPRGGSDRGGSPRAGSAKGASSNGVAQLRGMWGKTKTQPVAPAEPEITPAARTRASTPKRKRKRRN